MAKALSLRTRPWCDQTTSAVAATIGSDAGEVEEIGAPFVDERINVSLVRGRFSAELVDAAGKGPHGVRDRHGCAVTGGSPAGTGVDDRDSGVSSEASGERFGAGRGQAYQLAFGVAVISTPAISPRWMSRPS